MILTVSKAREKSYFTREAFFYLSIGLSETVSVHNRAYSYTRVGMFFIFNRLFTSSKVDTLNMKNLTFSRENDTLGKQVTRTRAQCDREQQECELYRNG